MLRPEDIALIEASQTGLPLSPDPYGDVASRLGRSRAEVLAAMKRLLAQGAIRRIGVMPNHYALGLKANGMTVWDVDDDLVDAVGERVGALPYVSHCYRRPRRLPQWRFNLFAMAHGRTRDEVLAKADDIAMVIGVGLQARDILFSKKILKKAGLRIAPRTASS